MDVQIRKALESDLDTLLTFEEGVVSAERPFDSTLKEGKIHYYDLLDLINSDLAELVVATYQEEIIGSGYAKILKAAPKNKFSAYAYLGFMYVKPSFRGKGVNKLIIEKLIAWAKSRDVKEVRLEVYDENIAAKKSYEKVGFKPLVLEMRLGIN